MAIANITNNILTDSGVSTSSLLPLTGGTLTGALNLTYATPYIYLNASTGSQGNLIFNVNSSEVGNINVNNSFFQITNFTTGGWLFKNSLGNNVFTIANNGQANLSSTLGLGGALSGTSATFSNAITANGAYTNTSDVAIIVNAAIPAINLRTASTGRFTIASNYSNPNTTSFLLGTGTNNPSTQAILLDHSTGAATFSSNVTAQQGVNVGANALGTDRMLQVSGTAFTSGATQFGIVNNPTMTTPTTIYGYYGGVTVTSATNGYGIYIASAAGTITNKFGIYQEGSGDKNYFAGNVGIGTNSAVYPFVVKVATNRNWAISNSGTGFASFRAGDDGYNNFNRGEIDALPLLLNSQSGGNVLIGTTTDENYKLYVNGGSANAGLFYTTSAANQIKASGTAPAITFTNTITSPTIGGTLGAATSANQFLTGTSAGDVVLINNYSGNRVYVVSSSGGVYLTSGATSWTANSDIRLKNINSHIENAVEKLSTLQTINFSYKDDKNNKQNLGLIAQEVEKIFPELIDKNGDDMLGVRYTELVPVLIKAIQELELRIKQLENK